MCKNETSEKQKSSYVADIIGITWIIMKCSFLQHVRILNVSRFPFLGFKF